MGAGGCERVDAEPLEAGVALALGQQTELAELAHVAEQERRAAVLELEPQMGVRVGPEARLLVGRERGARGGGEQTDRARVLDEELPRHAQVQHQAPAVVETRQQVLSDPLERVDARAWQLARETRGRREEEVARARGVHLHDAPADERWSELPARDLDLGKLGHRHSFLCGAASR